MNLGGVWCECGDNKWQIRGGRGGGREMFHIWIQLFKNPHCKTALLNPPYRTRRAGARRRATLCVTAIASLQHSNTNPRIVFLFGSKEGKARLNKGVRKATGTSKRFNRDATARNAMPNFGKRALRSRYLNGGAPTVWPETAGCHYLQLILLKFRIRLRTWPDLNSIRSTPPRRLLCRESQD